MLNPLPHSSELSSWFSSGKVNLVARMFLKKLFSAARGNPTHTKKSLSSIFSRVFFWRNTRQRPTENNNISSSSSRALSTDWEKSLCPGQQYIVNIVIAVAVDIPYFEAWSWRFHLTQNRGGVVIWEIKCVYPSKNQVILTQKSIWYIYTYIHDKPQVSNMPC